MRGPALTHLLAFTIFTTSYQQAMPKGKVVLKIKLDEFDSKGKDRKGDRCDPSWYPGNSKRCDPEFVFCVDKYSGSSSDNQCAYYRRSTGHYTNDDTVRFGSSIRGMPNPIVVKIQDYEGIRFKVDVDDDDDGNGDDDIDRFDWRTRDILPAKGESEATRHDIKLLGTRSSSKAELELTIWAYCDVHSYGHNCSVYCVRVDEDGVGHYGCDPDTGAKFCLNGWEGLNVSCLVKEDNCAIDSCQNGGVCHDLYNASYCECLPGWTGARCEEDILECASSPCHNSGTCVEGTAGYTCECGGEWTGAHCELHRCDHPATYCQHGGTCYAWENGTLGCECPKQYAGIHCDVDACQIIQCVHGNCSEGECICEPHFLGGLCDVRACDVIECANNGTCLDDGTCACTIGYQGPYCASRVSPCASSPCLNNGDCVASTDLAAATCKCQSGFNGNICQTVIESATDYDGQYESIIEKDDSSEESALPGWALGLIITIAVLCLLIIIIVASLLKYRRKYRKTVEESTAAPDMDNFVNPLYAAGEAPSMSYSASAQSVTLTTRGEKKAGLEEEEEEEGQCAPPPYTPSHAFSGLPSYEESEGGGGAGRGFVNQAYESACGGAGEDTKRGLDDSGVYAVPASCRRAGEGLANPLYDRTCGVSSTDDLDSDAHPHVDPPYAEIGHTSSTHQSPPSSAEPLYATVPVPRPVHTPAAANTEDGYSHALTHDTHDAQNDLNASLEGSRI